MRFVVQQHDATAMHWDLRLEAEDGTLKSWAVPKGPSMDPGAKRLAMRTGDHALDYIRFEGLVGVGEVGRAAGGQPVIVWDEGTYENRSRRRRRPRIPIPVVEAVETGHVTVLLAGSKLLGGFALTRTGTVPRERWVLVKMRDEHAAAGIDLVTDRPESVLSGLRIDQVGPAHRT